MADVLLIQPSVLRPIEHEEPEILAYFRSMSRHGSLMGDSPLEPNYGLLTLASVLRNRDLDVQVLDLTAEDLRIRESGQRLSEEHIETALRRHPAKVYGVSYMTVTYGLWAATLGRLIEKVAPDSVQIVGGIQPSMEPERVLSDVPQVDYVVLGEAEGMIGPLVSALLSGERPSGTPGVVARAGESSTHRLLSPDELDAVPYPAYDLAADMGLGFVPRIYSARGCPQRCNFCVVSDFFAHDRSTNGRYLRSIAGSTFGEHLDEMLSRFRPDFFCLGDLTFAQDRRQALAVCAAIEAARDSHGVDASWWAQTRADLIDRELASAMARAGCRQIAIGIEGADDAQRKRVIKNLRTETALDCLRLLRDLGFEIQTYWIIGLPRDDDASTRRTIELMHSTLEAGLTHLTHISVLVPYPGTSLRAHPRQLGIELMAPESEDLARYWMNCDPYGCGVPVYSTVDGSGRRVLEPEQIYGLWLDALSTARDVYDRDSHSGLDVSVRVDPRLGAIDA